MIALVWIHAIASWCATFGLLATAFERGRRSKAIRAIAAALFAIAFATGLALHEPFRTKLRQKLFIASAALGWLFERKQHAAYGAALFVVAALATGALARGKGGPTTSAEELASAERLAWRISAALALFALVASVLVGRRVHF